LKDVELFDTRLGKIEGFEEVYKALLAEVENRKIDVAKVSEKVVQDEESVGEALFDQAEMMIENDSIGGNNTTNSNIKQEEILPHTDIDSSSTLPTGPKDIETLSEKPEAMIDQDMNNDRPS